MTNILDWNSNRDMWIRVLKKQSGKSLDQWNKRVRNKNFKDENGLRAWLTEQGVTGYAANLLVMERFGYPDWVSASADELVEGQYSDRPHLRPIYDAIISAVSEFGEFTIQTRKTYVSLLTSRRTFARVRPSTKNRVDVGLRLEGQPPGGRLRPCKMQETMQVQIGLTSLDELDTDAINWLRLAYEENS
ncbi:DUF5655 domain-containing protein [Candidatus Leptofilum sp.]|uniref:DUF5655 domain-containing protein n=1 Tax=Candidatus Leptofilum sp. TaxID=3241576 RepID=UPI003B58B4D1